MSGKKELRQPLIVTENSYEGERYPKQNQLHLKDDDMHQFDEIISDNQVDRRAKFIELKHGVSWLNASNLFVTYFISIGQIVFFDVTLVYLLKSKDYFNVPSDEIASVTGNIVAYSQPFTLVFDILIGFLHDKIGRRIT